MTQSGSILLLVLDRTRPPGYVNDFFARHNITTFSLLLSGKNDLPIVSWCQQFDGVVVLDSSTHEVHLNEVERSLEPLLSNLISAGIPVLGEGRGAQLLTRLHNDQWHGVHPCHGWYNVRATAHLRELNNARMARAKMYFHNELGFSVPSGGEVWLENAQREPIACAGENSLALPFLISVTPHQYARWLAASGQNRQSPSVFIQTPAELRFAADHYLDDAKRFSAEILGLWSQKMAGLPILTE